MAGIVIPQKGIVRRSPDFTRPSDLVYWARPGLVRVNEWEVLKMKIRPPAAFHRPACAPGTHPLGLLSLAWVMFRYLEPLPASRGGSAALSMVNPVIAAPSAGVASGSPRDTFLPSQASPR